MLTLTSNFARLAVTAEQKNDSIMIRKQVYEEPIFKIHTLGSQELRTSSKRITKFNQDIKSLTRYMLQSMYTAKGIG
ncbi:MAG TPA: peptide deformylase, partial [Prochlorococcaceae cyanobacterium AMR_MDS_5431]|nr:peptide deformylase [Prochlorococcaceae cyanobacterium AMR_MDS_5431]